MTGQVARLIGRSTWCRDRDTAIAGGCGNMQCACEHVVVYARPLPEPECDCATCEFEREMSA